MMNLCITYEKLKKACYVTEENDKHAYIHDFDFLRLYTGWRKKTSRTFAGVIQQCY